MGKKTILDVKVKSVEKRRNPTKHYVYVLEVSWSEGTCTVVYRRYSDFFEFQCQLLERFPDEAGTRDPSARMIPFLPGKKLFGRSHVRALAEKRKDKIDNYCRTLVRLPPKISEDQFVMNFFEVTNTDLETPSNRQKDTLQSSKIQEISDPIILERYVAIADYEKQKKNECALKAGQTVEVIDKNENGWWFVNVDDFHEGWVPATYLEPLYGSSDETAAQTFSPGEEEIHITINPYTAQHEDELSFEKGVLVEVIEKGIDGWWKIRYLGQEGLAPAAYLHRYQGSLGEATSGAQVVTSVNEAIISVGAKALSSSASESSTPRKEKKISSPTSPKSPAGNTQFVSSLKEAIKPPSSSNNTSTLSASTPVTVKESVPVTSPSPKVAAAAEKPKFAPTWHSVANPYIDKEPIYAPTPRRQSFIKKPLKKRIPPPKSTSLTSPSFEDDAPEAVYEVIPEPEEEIYVTLGDFNAGNAEDGITFVEGTACTVITKNPTGWWYVEMEGKEGWVPSSYLERMQKTSTPAVHVKSPTSTEPPPLPVREKKTPPLKKVPLKFEPFGAKKGVDRERSQTSTKKIGPLSSSSTGSISGEEKQSSLKRSTSSDSGLNVEVSTKPKLISKRVDSPPTLHVTPAFKGGWNPQTTTTRKISLPENTRSPRVPRSPRTTSKFGNTTRTRPMISGPVLVKTTSPTARHKTMTKSSSSDDIDPSPNSTRSSTMVHSKAGKTVSLDQLHKPSNVRLTSVSTRPFPKPSPGPRPIPGAKPSPGVRPSTVPKPTTQRRESNSEDRNTRGTSHVRRGSAGASSPAVNARRGSNDIKSELQKRLQQQKGLTVQPKRTSPPNVSRRVTPPAVPGRVSPPSYLKKSPNTLRKAGPPQRPSAAPTLKGRKPERPKPPNPNTMKRPPPPRPNTSPALKRKPSYVAICDYSGDTDTCLGFKEGQTIEVIEKDNDGWWFVKVGIKEGWAPSTFLDEKMPSKPARPNLPPVKRTLSTSNHTPNSVPDSDTSRPIPKPRAAPRKGAAATTASNFYRAVAMYDVPIYEDSGVPLMTGRLYEVKEKADTGWWMIKDGDNEGWVPASYLEPA